MPSSFECRGTDSSKLLNEFLLCDDNQRLEHLVYMFAKHHMAEKRYETKTWHAYFRRVAIDPVVFYQYNAVLFYEDHQYDGNAFLKTEPICIHGDLHIGQFYYHVDDMSNERVFHLRQHKRVIAPFTWDIKRLATQLALIAYCHGLSDIEMDEILRTFTRKYIACITASNKISSGRRNSAGNEEFHHMKRRLLKKQCLLDFSNGVQYQTHEIDWHLYNTVSSLMTLAEQLASATASSHREPPICMFPTTDMMDNKADRNQEVIEIALATINQQQEFTNEICLFAAVYVQIAERDHRLFFKHYRNHSIFKGLITPEPTRIIRPVTHAERVPLLIVGGGIGGLATALSFAQAGIRVRLLERNTEISEVGAGIQLAPNCSRLLDRFGILKQVQADAVFPKQIVWMDICSGQRLACIDLSEKFIETFGYPYISVHRGDLLRALYQACLATKMVNIEINKSVTNVDERPKSIMVECADGMRYDCDMVVAADGIWSSLRKFVHDDGAPISAGYVTYRGTIPIDQVPDQASLENILFWIGPEMHLVQYLVRRGEVFNQAAVFRSKRLPDNTDQWGTKEELNEKFSTTCDEIKKSLMLLQTNFRWPVYDRNPLTKWSRGRLVLLGDAAHPMLQFAAQGATQALEDAFALAHAYKKHGPSKIDAVFREYELERIPRSSKVAQFARDIGVFVHHDGVTKILRDAIINQHDMCNYDFLKWLYGDYQKRGD